MLARRLRAVDLAWNGVARRFCSVLLGSGSDVPEDSEWWMVEGALLSVQDIRNVKKKNEEEPRPRSHRDAKADHLSSSQIHPQQEDQRNYWRDYLRVYEKSREEWETVVWDKPNVVYRVDDSFFDEPLVKRKKKHKSDLERKPFSMEEIQAAIRENVRHPVSEKNIEYRTAADTKWPF